MKKFFFLLFIIFTFSLLNSEYISNRIADIIIKGNNYVSNEYIIAKSELYVGQTLNTEDVQRAIRKLYASNMFKNISIDIENNSIGDVLNINVQEYKRINAIILKGNKKKQKEILENKNKQSSGFDDAAGQKNNARKKKNSDDDFSLQKGDFASDYNIFRLINKIKTYYYEKGYLNVEIDYELKEYDNNSVDIIVKIKENEIVRIKHIEIFGNYKITDNEIKSKLETKEKGFLKNGIFKEDDFEKDKKIIIQCIQETGYPDAKIDSIVRKISYDNKWMNIYVYVNPGERFVIGNIEFLGNEDIKTSVLNKFISMKQGDVFNKTKFDEMLSAIYEMYMDRGYLYLSIIPEEERDSLKYTISFTLNIIENEPATIRLITISGNEGTEDAVIRREILSLPGSIFNRSQLIVSHSNLFRLGYFEDVQINPVPQKDLGIVDINFHVKEKRTGEFNIGASYNEVDGFAGNIKLGVNNLLGKGLSSNLMLEKGANIANFQAGFTEPYLTGRPILAGFDLYYLTKDRIFYNDRRIGGKIKTGFYLSKKFSTKFYLSYKFEHVKIYTDSLSYDFLDPWLQEQIELEDSTHIAEGKYLSQISPSIVRDTRSHYFFPESGQMIGLYGDIAGNYLGGDIAFLKLKMDLRNYQKLFWKFVLMTRGAIGIVDGFFDPNEVPLTERFILGGVGTWGLRGYYDRSLGPKSGAYVIGGRAALLSNIEIRMKITDQAFLLGFFDIGNAWENYTEAKNDNFSTLYYSTGLGVRIEIPMMGIIGIDLGYGFVDSDNSGGKWEPHFQMGTSF